MKDALSVLLFFWRNREVIGSLVGEILKLFNGDTEKAAKSVEQIKEAIVKSPRLPAPVIPLPLPKRRSLLSRIFNRGK